MRDYWRFYYNVVWFDDRSGYYVFLVYSSPEAAFSDVDGLKETYPLGIVESGVAWLLLNVGVERFTYAQAIMNTINFVDPNLVEFHGEQVRSVQLESPRAQGYNSIVEKKK